MHVLAVEDDLLQLKRLQKICQKSQEISRFESFSTAVAALDYLQDNTIDLAIIDIELPDMSGMIFAEKLMKMDEHIMLAFVTASTNHVYDAYQMGAVDYVLKPYLDEQIHALISKASRMQAFIKEG